jgi:hypothetical protein
MRATTRILLSLPALCFTGAAQALDSYRYLHVTIDTPWFIFLFLLPIVLSPFILMAILYWHFAGRKPEQPQDQDERAPSEHD